MRINCFARASEQRAQNIHEAGKSDAGIPRNALDSALSPSAHRQGILRCRARKREPPGVSRLVLAQCFESLLRNAVIRVKNRKQICGRTWQQRLKPGCLVGGYRPMTSAMPSSVASAASVSRNVIGSTRKMTPHRGEQRDTQLYHFAARGGRHTPPAPSLPALRRIKKKTATLRGGSILQAHRIVRQPLPFLRPASAPDHPA